MQTYKLWLASLFLAAGSHSMASGLYLYEIGTSDTGLANAGVAARAQDASVIAFNPAGMTRLRGNQWSAGAQALYGDVQYHLDGRGSLSGNSPGNVIGTFPSASFFYSHSIDDRLKVGFATYGNFGLGLHFDDWAGRALMREATLLALTLQPSLAYKITPTLSLGAGLGVNYGLFKLQRDARLGQEKLSDHDWALNAKLGVLHELTPDTRWGLAYTSATRYDYTLNTEITRPNSPGNATLSFPISALVNTPQQLMFSTYHQLSPAWAIMGNLGWQDWSHYSNSEVWVNDSALPSQGRLRDTWHTAVGVQHQFSPSLRLHTGIAYDSSFYKDSHNAALAMPASASWRYGLGMEYQFDPSSRIGASFEYLQGKSLYVPSALFSGTYDPVRLYFFNVSYMQRF